jgi:hypothetical protein
VCAVPQPFKPDAPLWLEPIYPKHFDLALHFRASMNHLVATVLLFAYRIYDRRLFDPYYGIYLQIS